MQIKIIWTGSGTERGYQMRLQHLSFESNGFGVVSTGQNLDRVKKKKTVHLYSITLHLICGPFERKKKIQDTCTVLVVSFV